jgi:hypothetical protein
MEPELEKETQGHGREGEGGRGKGDSMGYGKGYGLVNVKADNETVMGREAQGQDGGAKQDDVGHLSSSPSSNLAQPPPLQRMRSFASSMTLK